MAEGINQNVATEAMSPNPSSILEFYLIYYDWPDDQTNFLALTPIQKSLGVKVIWQGVEYISYPMETEGFAAKGNDELPRPRVTVSNKDLTISKYLRVHNNLVGAKVVRKRTFARFLDDVNFEGGENPYFDYTTNQSASSPDAYLPDQTYYISRRVSETKDFVQFELASVFEMDNVFIPNRNVYSRFCTWIYRGHGCRYAGNPQTQNKSLPFKDTFGTEVNPTNNRGKWEASQSYVKGDFVFVEIENFPLRLDSDTDLNSPAERLKTFYVCVEDTNGGNENFPPISKVWQKDECGKRISDCKLRFTSNLRFGGFPGTHEYAPRG
jgi:lambda family phage minor tail protein L